MVFFLFFFWFTFPFPFCYSFSPPACFLQPQCKEVLKHTLNNVKLFSIQREYILVHECMSLNTQNFTFSSSLPAPLFRSPLPTTGIVLHSIFPTKPCDGFAVTWKYSLPPTHCSSLNIQLDNYKNRPRLQAKIAVRASQCLAFTVCNEYCLGFTCNCHGQATTNEI